MAICFCYDVNINSHHESCCPGRGPGGRRSCRCPAPQPAPEGCGYHGNLGGWRTATTARPCHDTLFLSRASAACGSGTSATCPRWSSAWRLSPASSAALAGQTGHAGAGQPPHPRAPPAAHPASTQPPPAPVVPVSRPHHPRYQCQFS